jgi:hypothetical protein
MKNNIFCLSIVNGFVSVFIGSGLGGGGTDPKILQGCEAVSQDPDLVDTDIVVKKVSR